MNLTISKQANCDFSSQTSDKPRAVLITKDSKVPLLWKVLGNNFIGKIDLGVHRDRDGDSFKALGLDSGSSKVLMYPAGSTKYALYEGQHHLPLK